MKKVILKKKIILSIVLVFLGMMGMGQNLPPNDTTQWHIGDLFSPDAEFKTIKENAEAYFAAHPEIDSINPMAKKIYKRWESYWKNRSTLVVGDTIVTNINEITSYIASLDFAISPLVTPQWKCITPDKSDFQNLGVITSTWSKPNDPNYILAGTESSGLWKTTDGGQNWVNITDSYNGFTAPPTGFYFHYPFGILSIAVHPTNSNIILIAATMPTGIYQNGGYGIGILKSVDGGNTWVKTSLFSHPGYNNSGLNLNGITKIVFDQINPNWIYAIGGLKVYFSNNLFDANQVILDCNVSSVLGFPLQESRKLKIRDIEVINITETPIENDRLIYVSTDSYNNFPAQLLLYKNITNTWSNVTNLLSNSGFKDVIMLSKDVESCYVNVAYQISDGGNNNKFCIDRFRVSPNGTAYTYQSNYLYHNNLISSHCSMFGYYYDSFEYVNEIFVVGGLGITYLKQLYNSGPFVNYNTIDYTNPFAAANDEGYGKNRKLHFGVRSNYNYSNSNRITSIVGTEGGVSKIIINDMLTSVADIKNINGKGLSIHQFADISTTNKNSEDIIIGGALHNGYWGKKIENEDWDNFWLDDGGKVLINDVNSNFIYAMTYSTWGFDLPNQYINNGYFLRSNDGLKLNQNTNPLIFPYFDWTAGQIPSQQIATVPPLIIDKVTSNTLYVGGHDVYRSVNNGNTWTQISTFPNNSHAKALKVITQSESNPTIMYAAFEEPTWCYDINNVNHFPLTCYQSETHKLYKYNGSNWNDISQNVNCQNALSWGAITEIIINPFNENEVWTSHAGLWSDGNLNLNIGKNRVLHSTNGGLSWQDFSEGLSCLSVNCIRFVKVNSDPNNYLLFVGTDAGVYFRFKTDTQWHPYRDGMPVAIVNDIEINESARKIRAATWGRGIWEADLPCMDFFPQFHTITTNNTWSTERTVLGILIKSGKTLTINANVSFAENTGIVIEKGATLIINNSTLSACNGMWNGIKIYGDYSFSQTIAGKHGKLIVNNSTIRDAIKAITTMDINNTARGGGIFEINSGSFINNMISINMQDFKNPNNAIDNSYIHNAKFVVNDNYHDNINYPFTNFINLSNINKFNILGCKFVNNKSYNINNNYTSNGIGIRSYNSVFYVNNYCNDPSPQVGICPPQYSVSSEFRNLEYGIYATTSVSTKNFSVKNTIFDKNLRGVYAMDINNAVFINNTFKIIDFAYYNNDGAIPKAYGMHLNSCSGYTVEGNLFDRASNSDYGSLGLVVHNSGSAINSIYNNTFKHMKYAATQPQDNNRGTSIAPNPSEGLKIKCNDYLLNKQDIKILKWSFPSPPVVGISYHQGTNATSEPLQATFPAGNRFSKFGADWTTDFKNTDGQQINYYHHQGNEITDAWVPLYCVPSGANHFNKFNTNAAYSKGLACPSIAVTGNGQLPTPATLNPLLTQASLNYNSAKLILQIWVDGGNTPELVQTTELAYPWEAYTLYNELLSKSPYLSDEVLIAAIRNEDALPPLMLKLILLSNPQAVRSQRVMDALYARTNPFPEEWIQELEQGLEVISPREHLEADVAYYATERKTNLDLLKKYYLEDTTASAYQSYTQLLAAETDIESRYELAFAQLNNNDIIAATATLSNMADILPDNETEVRKHTELTALFPVLNRIENEGVMWEDLDGNERDIITDLSDNNNELPGMLAKAVRMHFDTAYIYEEPIYADREQELRMAMPKNNNKLNTKSDVQDFKVSPNPANDFIIAEYKIDKTAREVLLIISDMQGRLQMKKQLTTISNQTLIDIRNLQNGSYNCTIIVDGQQKAVTKLIIQH